MTIFNSLFIMLFTTTSMVLTAISITKGYPENTVYILYAIVCILLVIAAYIAEIDKKLD